VSGSSLPYKCNLHVDASILHRLGGLHSSWDSLPENLSVFRKIAKTLFQADTSFSSSIRRKQRRALMLHDYLVSVLSSAAFLNGMALRKINKVLIRVPIAQ